MNSDGGGGKNRGRMTLRKNGSCLCAQAPMPYLGALRTGGRRLRLVPSLNQKPLTLRRVSDDHNSLASRASRATGSGKARSAAATAVASARDALSGLS